jgi:hypothetical protein
LTTGLRTVTNGAPDVTEGTTLTPEDSRHRLLPAGEGSHLVPLSRNRFQHNDSSRDGGAPVITVDTEPRRAKEIRAATRKSYADRPASATIVVQDKQYDTGDAATMY